MSDNELGDAGLAWIFVRIPEGGVTPLHQDTTILTHGNTEIELTRNSSPKLAQVPQQSELTHCAYLVVAGHLEPVFFSFSFFLFLDARYQRQRAR